MPPPHVRPIPVCIVRCDQSILVFEGHDNLKGRTSCGPPGGSVEFGELGGEAAAREFREEIGADLANLRYVGTLENLFTHGGHPGHEIVLVYKAEIAPRDIHEAAETKGLEDGGGTFKVGWKPPSDSRPGGDPLYPEGLPELRAGD